MSRKNVLKPQIVSRVTEPMSREQKKITIETGVYMSMTSKLKPGPVQCFIMLQLIDNRPPSIEGSVNNKVMTPK